jgi:2-polyprenyl-6-methoxyphenol hydroxylase-like FAD-dependent oxidoreductase
MSEPERQIDRHETADVVIAGGRCAGSATAIAFSRAGRQVIAVDRATFPSDTLSTHTNFPSAVAELQAVGALDRVLAYDPPRCTHGMVEADGVRCLERFATIDGIDYGICLPRPELDAALVATARDAGAEVREKTSMVGLLWRDGRVCGVRLRGAGGAGGPGDEYELGCRLVVGADGRRSSVAAQVGAQVPYRGSRNGRGAAFWYMDDPLVGTEWRGRMVQFRARETHTLIFPCPDDRMLVLFMGPAGEIPRFRADPAGMWERMLAENPATAERVAGATNMTKVRSTADTTAFFRRSSGPGWALAGDAGHFKDPIIGQGIRDALRFGRLLGEAAGPVLDDPRRLDEALVATERRRDRECLATYHWGNRESRIFRVSPLVKEVLRELDGDPDSRLLQMFDRVRAPHRVITPLLGLRCAARAAVRGGTDRRALLRELREEARIDADVWLEELTRPFRPTRVWASERPDYTWPDPSPARPEPEPGPLAEVA